MSLLFPNTGTSPKRGAARLGGVLSAALVHGLAVLLILGLATQGQKLAEVAKPLTVRLLESGEKTAEPHVEPPKPLPQTPRPAVRPVSRPMDTAVAPPVASSSAPSAATVVSSSPAPAKAEPFVEARFGADYLSNPKPPYPPASRRLEESGTVYLRVHVSEEGSALKVELKTSSGFPRLDQSALETVAHWKFVPARRGETPVASWVVVPIVFSLK